jgi:diguanylate cyclase (GGDEF)-like protein
MFKATTFNPALERDYQAELASRKVQLTRVTMVLAFVLNLAFAGLDNLVIRSALEGALAIRVFIATVAVSAFLVSYLPEFHRYYSIVTCVAFGGLGAGVQALVFLASPDDLAYDMYFMGMIMVAMASHGLTYLPLLLTSFMSLTFICAYVVLAVIEQNYLYSNTEAVFVTNLFFFVSMLSIAIIGQLIRDQYARENYLLRHSLSRDVELKEEARRRAAWIAENDALTGIGNRLHFEQHASAHVVKAVAEGRFAFVLFVDVNDFKNINDRYGHEVGDRALKFIAEQLHASLQPDDVLARNGGDEFVACLIRDNPDPLRMVLTRLISLLEQGLRVRGESLSISVSIGVACAPLDAVTLAETLSVADAAMYQIKTARHSGFHFSEGIQRHVLQAANDPVDREKRAQRFAR